VRARGGESERAGEREGGRAREGERDKERSDEVPQSGRGRKDEFNLQNSIFPGALAYLLTSRLFFYIHQRV